MSTPSSPSTVEERVRALAEEVLTDTDLFLVEVAVRGWKGSQVVEVYADREADPGEGADLDALADVSRRLGFLLDSEDVIDAKYRLDVSTPGLDRPLTDPRQYRRHVGRDLKVKTQSGETLSGKLAESRPDGFTLTSAEGTDHTIAFDDVQTARIELPW